MKCHYTYYFDKGEKIKVFIPGCWSTVHTGDMDDCTCRDITFASFEKEKYNEKLKEMQERIKSLECENKYLLKLLEKK